VGSNLVYWWGVLNYSILIRSNFDIKEEYPSVFPKRNTIATYYQIT
jgi:hypothetical protein